MNDHIHLRRTFDLALNARKRGDGAFGAVLVDADGLVLAEAENTVHTDRDCTAHPELKLCRIASNRFPAPRVRGATLYCSSEPCPMCAGAIFRSGIGRVVYSIDIPRLMETLGEANEQLPVRTGFALHDPDEGRCVQHPGSPRTFPATLFAVLCNRLPGDHG